jgi:uncharacterized membrane protein YciS (DUF1049 family)
MPRDALVVKTKYVEPHYQYTVYTMWSETRLLGINLAWLVFSITCLSNRLELGEPVKQINKKRSKKWACRIEAHEVKSAGRKPIKGGSRYGVVPTCVMLLCAVISSWVQLTHKIKDF